MTVIVALIVGYLVGRLVWLMARPLFRNAVFLRENYRGIAIPTGVGISIAFMLMFVEGARIFIGAAGSGAESLSAPRMAVLIAVLGFGLVGLLDDLAGDSSARGFKGHLGALAQGRLTTGSLKIFAGGAVALIAARFGNADSLMQLLADAALIALAANLANLFDRAPGRAIKASTFAFAILAIGTMMSAELVGTALVIGACGALFIDDLHERVMLGDAGANAIGAALGVGAVLALSPNARLATLAIVVVLNIVSEVISFGRVIDSVSPVRRMDRAGRRPRSAVPTS